ncbi:hypothetical protein [Facilibium subflavum]|uniref:hypothetical protein n=1 Tax=Facilibium subflavum TaxID=2219058 RepID=UPI0013C2F4A0|nr:hypothetical protein [Facilibium subflavum]
MHKYTVMRLKFFSPKGISGAENKTPTSWSVMLELIFCFVDDFCKEFMPAWQQNLIET